MGRNNITKKITDNKTTVQQRNNLKKYRNSTAHRDENLFNLTKRSSVCFVARTSIKKESSA